MSQTMAHYKRPACDICLKQDGSPQPMQMAQDVKLDIKHGKTKRKRVKVPKKPNK